MSCRETHFDFCKCYDYVCPCGAPYKHDENNYHWVEKDELCAECDRAMPDLACLPRCMETRLRAAFHLTSEEAPLGEFRALLAKWPLPSYAESWEKGELIQGKFCHPNSGVTLNVAEGDDLTTIVKLVLSRVEPMRKMIEFWQNQGFEAELACTAYIYDSAVPSVNLNCETLARIAGLGATLDLDIVAVANPNSQSRLTR